MGRHFSKRYRMPEASVVCRTLLAVCLASAAASGVGPTQATADEPPTDAAADVATDGDVAAGGKADAPAAGDEVKRDPRDLSTVPGVTIIPWTEPDDPSAADEERRTSSFLSTTVGGKFNLTSEGYPLATTL